MMARPGPMIMPLSGRCRHWRSRRAPRDPRHAEALVANVVVTLAQDWKSNLARLLGRDYSDDLVIGDGCRRDRLDRGARHQWTRRRTAEGEAKMHAEARPLLTSTFENI